MGKAKKLQFSYIKVITLLDRHGLVFLEANRSIHHLVFNAILKYIVTPGGFDRRTKTEQLTE